MRTNRIYAALVLAASMTACAHSMSPVTGFMYTNVKGTHSAGPENGGTKKGRACASSILGIIGSGDSSAAAAAKAGGIAKVSMVDYSSFSVLGLYAEHCTIVSGL